MDGVVVQQNQPKNDDRDREILFQRRLAELGFQRQRLPWNMGEIPSFEIPREESKLFADREIEDPNLTDEEIERRAIMDLLSQTYNFRTFYKRLHYELKRARRYNRALSVVLVGIDSLDMVAKNFGVDSVDVVVQSAGKLLLTCIRDVDIAGRCREDTFGVILPETPETGAEVAAERIRTRMEKHSVEHNWQKLTFTASVGVSCFPGTARSLDEFFAQAAEALLSMMKEGGNGVRFGR
jgi:diguanylate cyclase (GGDEF)-like protein